MGRDLSGVIGPMPYRMAFAGGWIDQPFVSRLEPGAARLHGDRRGGAHVPLDGPVRCGHIHPRRSPSPPGRGHASGGPVPPGSGAVRGGEPGQGRAVGIAPRIGEVVVGLWSDAATSAATGHSPKFTLAERRYLLESLRFVNGVVPIEDHRQPDWPREAGRRKAAWWAVSKGSASFAGRGRSSSAIGIRAYGPRSVLPTPPGAEGTPRRPPWPRSHSASLPTGPRSRGTAASGFRGRTCFLC